MWTSCNKNILQIFKEKHLNQTLRPDHNPVFFLCVFVSAVSYYTQLYPYFSFSQRNRYLFFLCVYPSVFVGFKPLLNYFLNSSGSNLSNESSVHTQEISVSTTPTRYRHQYPSLFSLEIALRALEQFIFTFRKKRALRQNQDNTEIKKTRQKDSYNTIPDLPSTSTALPEACYLPAMLDTAEKDNGNHVIDKNTVEKGQSIKITQVSSDEPNYEVQYLQANEQIKQLQHKVREQETEHEAELHAKSFKINQNKLLL